MLLKNGVLCDAHKECKADLRIDEGAGSFVRSVMI